MSNKKGVNVKNKEQDNRNEKARKVVNDESNEEEMLYQRELEQVTIENTEIDWKPPEVVSDIDRCIKIVDKLTRSKVIAVDAEGVNLGKDGPMTLLQVGTLEGDLYLFDIHSNTKLFEQGKLKVLLQSGDIVKVIHSCSGDSAALYYQFGIQLENVFDTQIAHLVIEEHKGRKLPSAQKLCEICKIYSSQANVSDQKETLKNRWMKEEGELWAERPLTDEMIEYASGDIKALIPEVYLNQKMFLDQNGLRLIFNERVQEEVNFHIVDTVKQRRNNRVEKTAKTILAEFETKYSQDISLNLITDNDDLKALNIIRFDTPGMSPMVKRLKKEYIQMEMKHLRDQLNEEGNNFIPKVRSFGYLRAYEHYTDDSEIQREAKSLRQNIDSIVLQDIITKYTDNTKHSILKQYEKEALRSLRPASEHDENFHQLHLALYWQLQEDEIDATIAQFERDGKMYSIPEGKYKWLKFVRSTNVYPKKIQDKVKKHLQNLDRMFGKNKCPNP